eukprot:7516043-Pyramimonas_sp.AAC.1
MGSNRADYAALDGLLGAFMPPESWVLCWRPAAAAHGSKWASCATAASIAAGVVAPPGGGAG